MLLFYNKSHFICVIFTYNLRRGEIYKANFIPHVNGARLGNYLMPKMLYQTKTLSFNKLNTTTQTPTIFRGYKFAPKVSLTST